jgi:Zn-dependent protease with chaperone function
VRFRQHQDQARSATRRLLLLFVLTVVLTVAALNAVLALLWVLQVGGLLGFPRWFFETNTVVATAFILGGSWLESMQLRKGGAHVAQMVGGRELLVPADTLERRLRNIVEEIAIASGLRPPRIFVLPRDDSINAFAAGWEQQDSVVAVTRGALERLSRAELQGVVAHEFSHILNGDARLNMRLIGHVWGLQLLFMLGRDLYDMTDAHGRRSVFVLLGLGLMGAGSIGWLAGRLLKAAVSRQREFLADAAAVQFTRLPAGIGGALRKIAGQNAPDAPRIQSSRAEAISHMLLASDIFIGGGALATHPPLAERIRRIFGRPMASMPSPVRAVQEAAAAGADSGAPLLWSESSVVALASPRTDALVPAGDGPADAASAPATDWIDDLLQVPLPFDLAAASLSLLVRPGNDAEIQAWRGLFADRDRPQLDRLLAQAHAMPPSVHQVGLERLLTRCAALPLAERRSLRKMAHRIVLADGQLSLAELWRCLFLDHVLDLAHESVLRETHAQSLAQCADAIHTISAALAWQHRDVPADATVLARRWRRAASLALALAPPTQAAGDRAPSLAALTMAMRRLARLAPMRRPQLLKTWVALVGHDEQAPEQAMWDSLRCICLLIDTPLPPEVQSGFA